MASSTQQIRDSSFSAAFLLWIIGIGFAAASALVFVSRPQQAIDIPQPAWFALICGMVGLLILWLAFHVSRRKAKYGRSVFESQSLPAVCGGVLIGTVRSPRPFAFSEPIQLRLLCMKHIQTGSESQGHIVWEDLCTLDRLLPGTAVSEFPVYFKIPGNAQPSSRSHGIQWRLDVKARTAGVHYSAMFVVPVTRGEQAAELRALPDPTLALRSPVPTRRQPLDRHLLFTPLSGGGGQFELLPGRNLVLAIVGMLFGAAFTGVGTSLRVFASAAFEGGGSWFPYVFTGMGAAAILICLRLLLLKTTITVRRGVISIETTVLSMKHVKEIRATEISDIHAELQGGCGNNRPFYSINATRLAGENSIKICGTIYDKNDAEWLASEFKRELAG